MARVSRPRTCDRKGNIELARLRVRPFINIATNFQDNFLILFFGWLVGALFALHGYGFD